MNGLARSALLGVLALTACTQLLSRSPAPSAPPTLSAPRAAGAPATVSAGPAVAPSSPDVAEYRDSRIDAARDSTKERAGTAPTRSVRLEQTAVIRPKLAPGERASLVARYAVSTPAAVDVKETRTVRFGDQVLVTRERVVARESGEWRSEFALPIPKDAAEGLYTVTTRVELTAAPPIRGLVDEKSAMFAVAPAASTPAPGTGPATTGSAPATPAAPARPPAGGTTPPTPKTAVAMPPRPDGTQPLRIHVWTDRQRYKVGDTLTFQFETTRDGYVTLVNAGTSGAVTILFPNRYSNGNQVKAKTRYSVPGPQDDYMMKVLGPPGIDLVYALVTLEPMKVVETDFSRTRSIFRSVDGPSTPLLTRDINVVVKQTPPDKQAKDILELEILP
jgi:hypothetical protein